MIKKINFPELQNKPFAIIPIALDDELLSSWIVRTAYLHKTHPHTFVSQYLNYRKYSFFSTQCDFTLNSNMIKIIQYKTRDSVDINSLTLTTYSGFLQSMISVNNPSPFFTEQKYCAACLKEDKIPYFRKKWKIAFYNICSMHKTYMLNKCIKCNTILDISKMYNNELDFVYCYNCGFDLRNSKQVQVGNNHLQALYYQNKIFEILDNGYVRLGSTAAYSFAFFDIFLKFTKLILIDKKHNFIDKHALFNIIEHSKLKNVNHPIFQKINIKAQSALFGLIMYLFDSFPINLHRYILENKLTHRNLTTKIPYVPFWYESTISELAPKYSPTSKTVTKEEVEYAKRHLESIGKIANKANLTTLLGCNFYSQDNKLVNFM